MVFFMSILLRDVICIRLHFVLLLIRSMAKQSSLFVITVKINNNFVRDGLKLFARNSLRYLLSLY